MLVGPFESPPLCSLGWRGGGWGVFHAWVQEECLLPPDTVFNRKACVGSTLWVSGEWDPQHAVLGEPGVCR